MPESRTWGVLIDGPGGIGKTALAVRAGHKAPDSHFSRKIFLSAKVRELTPQGEQKLEDFMLPNYLALLSELARELGDTVLARVPENERANAVRRTPLADEKALIVIDNVEDLRGARASTAVPVPWPAASQGQRPSSPAAAAPMWMPASSASTGWSKKDALWP